jgi:tRNA nucleotidyltransferase (CCA-adding enzyme)
VQLIKDLCKRLAVPNRFRDLAVHVAGYHTHVHRALELRPETIVKVLEAIDAFRRPERVEEFLLACEADARGRAGLEENPYHQADIFRGAYTATQTVDKSVLQERGLKGPEFGQALKAERVAAVAGQLEQLRGRS